MINILQEFQNRVDRDVNRFVLSESWTDFVAFPAEEKQPLVLGLPHHSGLKIAALIQAKPPVFILVGVQENEPVRRVQLHANIVPPVLTVTKFSGMRYRDLIARVEREF